MTGFECYYATVTDMGHGSITGSGSWVTVQMGHWVMDHFAFDPLPALLQTRG